MSLFVKPKGANRKMVNTQQGLFNQILITKRLPISINNIGNSIKETLEKAIAFQVEGKCIVEGYIKPNTVDIVTFSSGLVMGSTVMFDVVFQCYVCSPVEGMHINCVAKHINKAGIRAEVNETPTPVVIFIARDHNYTSPLFSQIKENDDIKVRVIGQRFELNDKYISIIAELIDTQQPPINKPPPPAPLAVKNTLNIGTTLNVNKGKTGKITANKKLSIAKEISTELAKEIADEIANEEVANEEVANEEVANEIAVEEAPVEQMPVAVVEEPIPVKNTTLKRKLKIKN
jgi:DNA-directed RNA polymerase subunit E'/Rpb7